ncbi:MAG TPA: SMP-30/gluconolactonase/LRE family protein [Firmicutes bacterium]|jgi:sugar lactone lactonase YvrE|nr:SMP-30/gluconolactonase/LRE family protein [Bacillota bacterium]
MKLEAVVDVKCKIGEGPLWHPQEKRLYWVDIPDGILFRYDPLTSRHEEIHRGELIGGYTIQEDGSFLFFMDKGLIRIYRNGNQATLINEVPELRSTRFNDVIADPVGRVFCGTMPDADGQAYLYRLDTDGTLDMVLDGIGLSNGMGFTPDKKQMYHVDSKKHLISIFDYNETDGSLSNRKVFLKLDENEIEPDGLTVDAEGHVWVAFWNAGCIRRFAPDGRQVLEVSVPAKKTTSMTFGGNDYNELYITSAGGDDRPEDGTQAGALFRIRAGIRGLPEHLSRVCI